MSENMIVAWIGALRSGRYRQGYGQMYNMETGCVCATGVLGEVLADAGLARRRDFDDVVGLYGRDYVAGDYWNTVAFQRITGLSSEYLQSIQKLNDSGRMPFPVLADRIAEEAVNQGLITREEALAC